MHVSDTITVAKDFEGRSFNLEIIHPTNCKGYTNVTAHAVRHVLTAAAASFIERIDGSSPNKLGVWWSATRAGKPLPKALHPLADEWVSVMQDVLDIAGLPAPDCASITAWLDA